MLDGVTGFDIGPSAVHILVSSMPCESKGWFAGSPGQLRSSSSNVGQLHVADHGFCFIRIIGTRQNIIHYRRQGFSSDEINVIAQVVSGDFGSWTGAPTNTLC